MTALAFDTAHALSDEHRCPACDGTEDTCPTGLRCDIVRDCPHCSGGVLWNKHGTRGIRCSVCGGLGWLDPLPIGPKFIPVEEWVAMAQPDADLPPLDDNDCPF